MRTEIVLDMPELEYFADPCEVPALSHSIAQTLERKSPLHAWAQHPRLGGKPRRYVKNLSFEDGTLMHRLLLGKGPEIVEVEADDWRTAAARKLRDEARAMGFIPLLSKDIGPAREAAARISERFEEYGYSLVGESEVSIFWVEDSAVGPVQCRARLDHVDRPVIIDLKSTRSAHPKACQKHIDSYGYAIQHATYTSGLETVLPELAGRVEFVFLFFELEPPFAVTPVKLSGEFRELGRRRWRRAVETWGRCLATNRWDAYVTETTTIEPTPWALDDDAAKGAEDESAEAAEEE